MFRLIKVHRPPTLEVHLTLFRPNFTCDVFSFQKMFITLSRTLLNRNGKPPSLSLRPILIWKSLLRFPLNIVCVLVFVRVCLIRFIAFWSTQYSFQLTNFFKCSINIKRIDIFLDSLSTVGLSELLQFLIKVLDFHNKFVDYIINFNNWSMISIKRYLFLLFFCCCELKKK